MTYKVEASTMILDPGNSASKEAYAVLLMERSFAWNCGMPFVGALIAANGFL
jgi:hypothetical protein